MPDTDPPDTERDSHMDLEPMRGAKTPVSLIPDRSNATKAQITLANAALVSAALGGVASLLNVAIGARSTDVAQVQNSNEAIIEELRQDSEARDKAHEARFSVNEAVIRSHGAHIKAHNQRINSQADWMCQENQGRPHDSWPCHQMTWETSRNPSEPKRTTNRPWPKVEDTN